MIIPETNNTILTNIDNSKEFDIVQDNAKIFHILSNLYKDKVGAVVREIGTNCLDAHKLNNNELKPFEIYLPTEKNGNLLTFRDFGPGIDEDNIDKVFRVYGKTTKDKDNIGTGCLGLGAKSPYSISSQYHITSYTNGNILTYLAFEDEKKKPRLSLTYKNDQNFKQSVTNITMAAPIWVNPNMIFYICNINNKLFIFLTCKKSVDRYNLLKYLKEEIVINITKNDNSQENIKIKIKDFFNSSGQLDENNIKKINILLVNNDNIDLLYRNLYNNQDSVLLDEEYEDITKFKEFKEEILNNNYTMVDMFSNVVSSWQQSCYIAPLCDISDTLSISCEIHKNELNYNYFHSIYESQDNTRLFLEDIISIIKKEDNNINTLDEKQDADSDLEMVYQNLYSLHTEIIKIIRSSYDTGLKIDIPINKEYEKMIIPAIKQQLYYFPVPPILYGMNINTESINFYEFIKTKKQGIDYIKHNELIIYNRETCRDPFFKITKIETNFSVIQGCVKYNLNLHKLLEVLKAVYFLPDINIDKSDIDFYEKYILENKYLYFDIFVENGSINFAPSREEIIYDTKTCQKLFNIIVQNFKKIVQNSIDLIISNKNIYEKDELNIYKLFFLIKHNYNNIISLDITLSQMEYINDKIKSLPSLKNKNIDFYSIIDKWIKHKKLSFNNDNLFHLLNRKNIYMLSHIDNNNIHRYIDDPKFLLKSEKMQNFTYLKNDLFNPFSMIFIIMDSNKFTPSEILKASEQHIKNINDEFSGEYKQSNIIFITSNQLNPEAFEPNTKKINKEKIAESLLLPSHRIIYSSDFLEKKNLIKPKKEYVNQDHVGYAQDILSFPELKTLDTYDKIYDLSKYPIAIYDKRTKSFNLGVTILDKFEKYLNDKNLSHLYINNSFDADKNNDILVAKKIIPDIIEKAYLSFLKEKSSIKKITAITKQKNYEKAVKQYESNNIYFSYIDDDEYLKPFFELLIQLKNLKWLSKLFLYRNESIYKIHYDELFSRSNEIDVQLLKYVSIINKFDQYFNDTLNKLNINDVNEYFYLYKFSLIDSFSNDTIISYLNNLIQINTDKNLTYIRLLLNKDIKLFTESDRRYKSGVLNNLIYNIGKKMYPDYLLYSLYTAIHISDKNAIEEITQKLREIDFKCLHDKENSVPANTILRDLKALHNNICLQIPDSYWPKYQYVDNVQTDEGIVKKIKTKTIPKKLFKYLNKKIFKILSQYK